MTKQRIMVTLTTRQIEQLDAIATETGVSRSGIVSLALSQWLRGWNPPENAKPRTEHLRPSEIIMQ